MPRKEAESKNVLDADGRSTETELVYAGFRVRLGYKSIKHYI